MFFHQLRNSLMQLPLIRCGKYLIQNRFPADMLLPDKTNSALPQPWSFGNKESKKW